MRNIKFLSILASVLILVGVCFADESVNLGLNLTVPSPGQRNWANLFISSFAEPISRHQHTGSGDGLQIPTSGIANNAVTAAKIRIGNDEYIKAQNQAGSGTVDLIKADTNNRIYFGAVSANVPPPGVVMHYAGTTAPDGFLLGDGSAVSRTTYSALFAITGETYGAGNGSSTFNLPDCRQRFLLGKAASGTGSTLGSTGGAIDHTHSAPAHYHGMGTGADLNVTSSGSHAHTIDHDHSNTTTGGSGELTSNSGGGHAHFTSNSDLTSTDLGAGNYMGRSYDASNDFSYDLKGSSTTANRGLTSSDGIHTHTVNSHTHTVDTPSYSGDSGSATHTHSSGDISGRIGLVTGGVDGNSAMTSGTQNPPFLSLNCIIKY